jgi:hypothetical protein
MPLVVMLLVNLKKLVGEEKLAEAEKAVYGEFMNMGTTVFRNDENMDCTVVRGNSVITLTIYNTGIAEFKLIHNHACRGYNTLQGVLDDIINAVTNALNVEQHKVVDAVDRLVIGTTRTKH